MSEESPHFKVLRKKLRKILIAYEKLYWSDVNAVSDDQMEESDKAEQIAEEERAFLEKRKSIIRNKVKALDLTQKNWDIFLAIRVKRICLSS
ncbi:MAG: hypothetical protein ACTHMC_00515 [Pseudobacter sp.]|uniref:hypothetical protein n=1 Tax=Pseudobacter sp. TaxID=2045420 RepID=UPI003F800107